MGFQKWRMFPAGWELGFVAQVSNVDILFKFRYVDGRQKHTG